jgi:hypothetical protein
VAARREGPRRQGVLTRAARATTVDELEAKLWK